MKYKLKLPEVDEPSLWLGFAGGAAFAGIVFMMGLKLSENLNLEPITFIEFFLKVGEQLNTPIGILSLLVLVLFVLIAWAKTRN